MKNTTSKLPGDEMQTLSQCMNKLKEHGFTKEFRVTEEGLITKDDQKVYHPDQVEIVNFYRFEGESSPDDSAILYAVETNDGSKGILSDAYGAYADEHVTKFISEVEKIHKKTDINPNPKADEKPRGKEIFKTSFLW
ncbi:MAG TPA: hypothetical protein VE978_01415 [Chitinophagales bacterium]|nr:hypothetical protein [Chitinophagales bacterium]